MHRPVRRPVPSAAVIFTAIIAFQSVGWLLAWQALQLEAGLEAQRILSQAESDLVERTFHKAFFQTIRIGGKEIRLNGQLFDYRILSEKEDSVQVSLYRDDKEEALLSALDRLFKSGDDAGDSTSTPLALWFAKWLGSAFLLPEKPAIASKMAHRLPVQNFFTALFTAQSAPGVFAPPPEL